MVNKYWDLKDVSYDTMARTVECYGVIDIPLPTIPGLTPEIKDR